MIIKVIFVSSLFVSTKCGFPFNDRPVPRPQFGPPPGAPTDLFRQLRPPNFGPPPPPPPDIRDILRRVPIISNLVRGQQDKFPFVPERKEDARIDIRQQNNIHQGARRTSVEVDGAAESHIEAVEPKNNVDFEPMSTSIEGNSDKEPQTNELPDSDVHSLTDVTSNSVEDREITSTTEEYETTTDDDLSVRIGPPSAVVASLLG